MATLILSLTAGAYNLGRTCSISVDKFQHAADAAANLTD